MMGNIYNADVTQKGTYGTGMCTVHFADGWQWLTDTSGPTQFMTVMSWQTLKLKPVRWQPVCWWNIIRWQVISLTRRFTDKTFRWPLARWCIWWT